MIENLLRELIDSVNGLNETLKAQAPVSAAPKRETKAVRKSEPVQAEAEPVAITLYEAIKRTPEDVINLVKSWAAQSPDNKANYRERFQAITGLESSKNLNAENASDAYEKLAAGLGVSL